MARLSWGRLLGLCLLVLIAESILTENVLHWGDHPTVIHTKTVGPASKGPAETDEPDVHIGPDGITITHRGAAKTAPVAPEDALKESEKHSESPAGAPGDEMVEVIHERSRDDWLKDAAQGLVLLLIVYLIAAKIVMNKAAASDARAAQAEANAAVAAAAAERETLERQLTQAQLQALQAQVEPHFLFNTLASVDYLIETDPPRASAMQKNLIQYLRASLPYMRGGSSNLGREIDLIRAYLEILKVRMENRLTIAVDVPDGLRSAEFPPMMLQSLVENAIRHGVEPKAGGGEVRVSATVLDGQLEVLVADTGVGLSSYGGSTTAGSGLGLSNIRERLDRFYPQGALLALEPLKTGGAQARIRIPYRVVGDATKQASHRGTEDRGPA